MHVLRLSSLVLGAALVAAVPGAARGGQLASDEALACLLPVFDGQGPLVESRSEKDRSDKSEKSEKSDRIDPKAAEAAAKAKAKWWRNPELRAEFAITDAQSAELDRIFHSFYASLKSGMADVDRYHKDVSKIMAEGSSSEVDVLHAIDKLEAAKASLSRTRMLMLYRMYRLLSPDQRIKVKRYHEQKDAAASAPR
jgi:Spy/CpxP family protein refolding chaperone